VSKLNRPPLFIVTGASGSGKSALVEGHRQFARWLLDDASTAFDSPMPTIDTSDQSVEETADAVTMWVREFVQAVD
jgi:RNase adaptor protein for sRNA GlmZ degradation